MEDPFFPRDPSQLFGASTSPENASTCGMDELARVLRESTKITPSRFTWITAQDLCHIMRTQSQHQQSEHQQRPLNNGYVIVDTRTDAEAGGGRVAGSVRASTRLCQNEVQQLVGHYRAGRRVIFLCLRSQARAPLAAQKLLQVLDRQGARNIGEDGVDADSFDPKVCVVEGGFVALIQGLVRSMPQQVQQMMASLHDVDQYLPAALIQDFEPDRWAVTHSPDGPLVAHTSELQSWGMLNAESREAEELMEAETSEELSYLVDQRLSLSPPAAGSMPYIS
mmetsp:Transcript_40211/g.64845  ORF Transcript_40211/g.64845 Transcript_40211/m.64845 type:complete len:280 (+) Transcript_40211:278-1117(+)